MTTLRTTLDAFCPPFLRGFKARLEASPLGYRLAKGAFWSIAGNLLSRSMGLVSTMLVARLIGKVGLGELGMVQSTLGMFSTLAGLGMGLAATKHVAEYRSQNPKLAGEIIGLLSLVSWTGGSLTTIAVFFLAPWLAAHTMSAPQLTHELQIGTLLLVLGVVNGIQTGTLAGFEAFKTIARINLFTALANFPLMVGLAYWDGVTGAVWGLAAVLALNCFLNFLAVRQECAKFAIPITFTAAHRHGNLIWSFGVPGMLSGLIAGPVTWVTSTCLVSQPNGYAEMGILNATNSWFQAVAFLPNLVCQVLLPILSSYSGQKDQRGIGRALTLATIINVVTVLPIVLVGSLFARQIMQLYGPGFANGWPVLVLTLFVAAALMVQGPIANHLIANSKMWAYFWSHIIWAATLLSTTYWLVPAHGAAGLSTARLIAYIVNGFWIFGVFWWYARQKTPAAE